MLINNQQKELIFHCCSGNLHEINKLLANMATVDFEDEERNSPLNTAVINKKYDVVNLLIMHGANIHYIDGANTSLLHLAPTLMMFDLLLSHGMDVHFCEQQEDSPLYYQKNNFPVAQKMIDLGVKYKHLSLNNFSKEMVDYIEQYEIKKEKDNLENKLNTAANQTNKIKL